MKGVLQFLYLVPQMHFAKRMSKDSEYLRYRFQVGDRVIVKLAGTSEGKEGTVRQIIEHSGEQVYWYRVRFVDGDGGLFFAFELKPKEL